MEPMRLISRGPFSWLKEDGGRYLFESPEAREHGIYLWTVPHVGHELVYYVGETGRSFADRTREHLFCYLGGRYRIHKAKSFIAGQRAQIWPGMWKSGDEYRANEFLQRRSELGTHLHQMLSSMRIWLIPMGTHQRTRCLIEGAISQALRQASEPACSFQEDDIRYQYRGNDEPTAVFTIGNARRFIGLPERMST